MSFFILIIALQPITSGQFIGILSLFFDFFQLFVSFTPCHNRNIRPVISGVGRIANVAAGS